MSRKITYVRITGIDQTFQRTEYPGWNRVEYRCVAAPVVQESLDRQSWLISVVKKVAAILIDLLISIFAG